MRLIHTADWHLGHTLQGISREYEHRCFLDWLLDTLEEKQADALLIAGDVFDSANPPATAQAMFYRFLAQARQRCPQLDIVVIGGNHDSPARLEAPQPLLESMGVRVVGALPRGGDGHLDLERLSVPLHNQAGEIAAWCAAVPFLRPADLPPWQDSDDPLIEGVYRVYQQALSAIAEHLDQTQALIATGHCYMVGTRVSELSERKILGGNQHALPSDIFPTSVAYSALGHLHLAQAVAGREEVRYSGSPIPLSLSESGYPHQVVQVDLKNGRCYNVTALRVPRSVEILRLPEGGPRPLNEVVRLLRSLDMVSGIPPERQPFLEVSVRLDQPEPGLRRQIDEALADKPVRLLKISPYYPGAGDALADSAPEIQLQELSPDTVFIRRYRQQYDADPPEDLLAAFHELLEQIQEGADE